MNHAPLHPAPNPNAWQHGLSLIELMIAMAIGLVLVVTVGYAYLGAKKSFQSQSALAQVQENARYAFEFMGTDIRMAGYTGSDPNPATAHTDAVATPTWDPNLRHLFNSETDTGGAPLIGYNDPASTSTAPTGTTACTSPLVAGCYLTGDAITVVRADDSNIYRVTAYADPVFTLGFTTCPTSSLPAQGDIFVAADYTHAAVFQIKAASGCAAGAMTVTRDNSTLTPGFGNLNTFNAPTAIQLYRLSGVTYYIGKNAAGEPALYRLKLGHTGATADTSKEELVEGVSDMQVSYGVDTDATADKNVNAYWTAAQVSAGSDGTLSILGTTGTVQDYWSRVLSVRVTLTLTTLSTEHITTSGGLYTKSFTTTFAVRNRL